MAMISHIDHASVSGAAHGAGGRIADFLGAATKRLMKARMAGVLNRFSDDELARMGVARRDIDAYAERLVYED